MGLWMGADIILQLGEPLEFPRWSVQLEHYPPGMDRLSSLYWDVSLFWFAIGLSIFSL